MNGALLVGLGMGAGVALVLSGLFPAPVPLHRALADLHRPPSAALGASAGASRLTRLLGETWVDTHAGRELVQRFRADLQITSTAPAEHLAHRVAVALVALVWAPATAAIMSAGGVGTGVVLPLWVSVALAPAGFLYPSITLRSRASVRRAAFRHALGSFLDIVAISLAGGRGVESALHDAADSGHGWSFDQLRRALLDARLLGETPWAALDRLGAELDVAELRELAASAALAGAEGARVRTSVAAKARAIRVHGLTDVEAAAQSASERMSLPVVLLMVGFVVFLTYPAVERVLTGL